MSKTDKKKEEIQKTLEDLLPVIDFNEELGVGIMRDGSIIDCFEIICSDLQNDSDANIDLHIMDWEKLFSIYNGDLKIVSSFFPVNTNKQVAYLTNILEQTENPLYKELIQSRIKDLKWIHQNYVNRAYMLYFFAKNLNEYKDFYTRIMVTLNGNIQHLKKLNNKQKKEHFFLLNNKNLNF